MAIFDKIGEETANMNKEKLYDIWLEWKIVEQLGEGSFGKVYKIQREEHGLSSTAAVKVISIPLNDSVLASLRSEGLDDTGTRSYFEGIVTDFVNEIKLMQSMKGTSNIVSVEDYKVVEKTDKIGWDIFIRMELLTPLNDYIANKTLDESDIIKLGQDVCTALELCAQKNIIHRDIKPENIFVSSFGDFKVGDFGIARELEKTSGSLSQKGTFNYMAPEITTSKHYDSTVDIYSLGLVLYKLLNNNRLPFLDPNAQLIQYQDRKNAIDRRLSGEAIPAPVNGSEKLAKVILTACAFDPSMRFKTPTAFKNALGAIKGEKPSPIPSRPASVPEDENATVETCGTPDTEESTEVITETPAASFDKKKKKKSKAKKLLIAFAALICLAGIGVAVFFINPGGIFDFVQDTNGEVIGDIDATGEMNGDAADDAISTLEDEELDEESAYELNLSQIAFNTAEDMYYRGDYAGAILQYRLVIPEDPNFEAAQEGLERAVTAFRTHTVSEVDGYTAENDFGSAIRTLNNALGVIEDDPELMQMLTTVHQQSVSTAIAEANALAAQGEHSEATAVINDALRITPGDEQLGRALSDIQDGFVTTVVAEAEALLEQRKHDAAEALIDSALREVPRDERLTEMRDDVEAARPVGLAAVVVVDSMNFSQNTDVLTDSFGNLHHESFQLRPQGGRSRQFSGVNHTAYVVYNLNGEFSLFTVDIVAPSGLNSDVEFLIEIAFEDNVTPVAIVEGFNVRTGTRYLEVDVSGVTTMTITARVRGTTRNNTANHNIFLVNATLSR